MNKNSKAKNAMISLIITGVVALVLGFILLAIANNIKYEVNYFDPEEVQALKTVKGFSTFFFIDAGIELVAALLIGVLSGNEKPSEIPTNSNNYNRYNYSDRVAESGFWICPRCKRENANYVGSCACGESRPSANGPQNISNINNSASALNFCHSCGQKANGQTYCSNCGTKLN